MLISFFIDNFRCFKSFSIKPLARVNLITGKNNVGKTALLEGIFLLAGATNPQLALNINRFRGIETIEIKPDLQSETPWISLFYGYDENKKITMVANVTRQKKHTLQIKIDREQAELVVKRVPDRNKEGVALTEITGKSLELEYTNEKNKSVKAKMVIEANKIKISAPPIPIPFNAIFLSSRPVSNLSEDAERFSELEVHGQVDILLEVLKIIEPKLKKLSLVYSAGVPMIYGDIGINRLLPLAVMGEGMSRVSSLVLALAHYKNGIVFVDEIENGIHYALMEKIWRSINEASKQFNTQVFATTHSRECVVSAYNAFSINTEKDFLLHRLNKSNGKIDAKTYSKKTLEAAIDTELEVR